MKRKQKRISIIPIFIIIALMALVAILFIDKDENQISVQAYKNLDLINIGDEKVKVVEIMGEPLKIKEDEDVIIFSYGKINNTDIDITDVTIYLDSGGKVIGKSYGEKGNPKTVTPWE